MTEIYVAVPDIDASWHDVEGEHPADPLEGHDKEPEEAFRRRGRCVAIADVPGRHRC